MPDSIICDCCREPFQKRVKGRGGYNELLCSPCRNDKPKKYRHWDLRKKYGIGLADYNDLHASQNGRCATCNKEVSGPEGCLDHCHTTMKVRGILCMHCNFALGSVFDNTETLENMIAYLRRNQGLG